MQFGTGSEPGENRGRGDRESFIEEGVLELTPHGANRSLLDLLDERKRKGIPYRGPRRCQHKGTKKQGNPEQHSACCQGTGMPGIFEYLLQILCLYARVLRLCSCVCLCTISLFGEWADNTRAGSWDHSLPIPVYSHSLPMTKLLSLASEFGTTGSHGGHVSCREET